MPKEKKKKAEKKKKKKSERFWQIILKNILISLAQIKAENNSYKLKNEIRQILYLLYQHNKISKKL